jgi:hypothetical protein
MVQTLTQSPRCACAHMTSCLLCTDGKLSFIAFPLIPHLTNVSSHFLGPMLLLDPADRSGRTTTHP